jgi:hypothetical protein
LTLPHKRQSGDNYAIDAEFEAKQPALLYIDRKGEGGPKTAFARTDVVEGKRCLREEAYRRQARTEGFMRDPTNAKPHSAGQEPHGQRVAHPTRLEIKVVGAGERSIYIAGLTTFVYYEGRWIRGIPFFPELHEETDSEGIAKKYLKMTHKRDEDTTVVTCMKWKAFKAGQNVLSYGEPAAFSYVCYYDIPGEDRHAINRLRVRINDYLGNSYDTTVATDSMMLERLPEVALVVD